MSRIQLTSLHKSRPSSPALLLAALLMSAPAGVFAAVPAFSPEGTGYFGLTEIGMRSAPVLADLDGDGDLDILSGEADGRCRFFRNTGNSTNAAFAAPVLDPFGISDVGYYAHPALVKLDGDSDFDLVVGELSGNLNYFRNTGNSTNPLFVAMPDDFAGLTDFGSNAKPSLVDIDGDGDMDAFIGGIGGGFGFFRNTGTPGTPAFDNAIFNPFNLTGYDAESAPVFVDIEGDGDMDLIVGLGLAGFAFFENAGSNIAPSFYTPILNPIGLYNVAYRLTPSLGDIDGDGDLDMIAGENDGDFFFFHNTVDVIPPVVVSGISNFDDPTSDRRVVRFGIEFSEPVAPSFTVRDINLTGTLENDATLMMESDTQVFTDSGPYDDPLFVVAVMLQENDANGTIGISLTGDIYDPSGNLLAVPVNSALYTIDSYPPGDVSKNGVFDLSDVALLSDANLGLVTLP